MLCEISIFQKSEGILQIKIHITLDKILDVQMSIYIEYKDAYSINYKKGDDGLHSLITNKISSVH